MTDPAPWLDLTTDREPLLLDACVVLSLYATGMFERVLAAAAPVAVVSENVAREALFVH